MSSKLVQCIPNFSTSHKETGMAIAEAIRLSGDVQVLDLHWDIDHARTVVTFVGPPESLKRAILSGVTEAVQLIDLRKHLGAHPRIGVADVIPLVPLRDIAIDECIDLSYQVGQNLADNLNLPIYFYELSARKSHRTNLAEVRKGGFEALKDIPLTGNRKPDVGPDRLHPSAGASVVGVRKPLIAFNVNLNTNDLAVAKQIAAKIRAVRDSKLGLPGVKAIGIDLPHLQCAQVSMNITEPDKVTLQEVFSFVEQEAQALGSGVEGVELVGMIRLKHLQGTSGNPMLMRAIGSEAVLDYRIPGLPPP